MRRQCTIYLAACSLLLWGCSRKTAEETGKGEAAATPVEVAAARSETLAARVEAEAILYPLKQATIVPKISAPVERLLVTRGDHVKAGQLVAVLEAKDLLAAAQESKQLLEQAEANFQNTTSALLPGELTRARSDLQSAEESLDASTKVYESRVKLLKEGALSEKLVEDAKVAQVAAQSTLDTAKQHLQSLKAVGQSAQLRAAQAQVAAAAAHYRSSEAQLGYTRITSPIAGVVSDRPIYVGEIANSGAALLTVVEISQVVARATVAVEATARMRVGQPAEIKDGVGTTLKGKVMVVSPAVDPNTTTVQVWVAAANPDEALKLGTTVRISVLTGEIQNATVVPVAALLASEDGGEKVMLAGTDSVAHAQKVEVGIRSNGMVQIVSGVKPGDKVIVSGALGLDDGAKIEVTQQGGKGGEKEQP